MKQEYFARILVVFLVLGASFITLFFQYWQRSGVIEVHAAMPDKGGWLTSNINTKVGETLHLRLVSNDVVHSFALGQSEFEPVDVLLGKPTDLRLSFDQPGTYTFYCTRWCGEDHWRMRGTIVVAGEEAANMDMPDQPLYLQLGIDLDAPHKLHDLNIEEQPSADNNAVLDMVLPADLLTLDYYRSHSPLQTWEQLKSEPAISDLSDSQIWDLVARIWEQRINPAKLAEAALLYQRDCAACHGVDGKGDGVFGVKESSGDGSLHEADPDGHSRTAPTKFTDLNHMVTLSPAFLQGKIIRGGMGTGMPSWGLIYTEKQTWALVDYIWTFVFDFSFDE
jgi:mono/diheme cytochrome c family protein/plastocyanin